MVHEYLRKNKRFSILNKKCSLRRKRKKKIPIYKKKRGRPKKYIHLPFKYKIILVRNGKQTQYIGAYKRAKDVYTVYKRMIDNNKKDVRFPVKYVNGRDKIREAFDEIIILKVKEECDSDTIMFRNEYGEFIPCMTKDKYDENSRFGKRSDRSWKKKKKSEWMIEETFWMYGFHPRNQRKDFRFIYKRCIQDRANDKDNFTRCIVYQNKVIFDYGSDMDIVFCKNVSDSTRLYTEMNRESVKMKVKNVIWSELVRDRMTASYWLDKLQAKTGFTRLKLKRNSLRP